MDSLMNVIFIASVIHLNFVFAIPPPLPNLVPEACNLTVWHGHSDVTSQRIVVLEGDTINLVCDARCTNDHYAPVLKWINPNYKLVWDIPGRLFTAPMNSHRLQTLYIQDISVEDIGVYKCQGWIGHWTETSVQIAMDEIDLHE
ncbi:uncharacterized protein LOC127719994 [Mytilus californianus]|uniref:uncharacterized protein LOC127719994 n=1 Tax=Mytilus californianus TaxID=6549 RepID=UPI002245B8D3|nr:uncharacterized protein LOC127719994 [Mytilus californianus]